MELDDGFSSVENMLIWQIEQAKKEVKDLELAIEKHGEVYVFSKEADGLPDSWAYGKLTSKQVSMANAAQGISFVRHQIELTEADLNQNDFPSAIYRVINVYKVINSVSASWASSSSVRAYRFINKYRQSKSEAARYNRKNKPSKRELIADRENYYFIHQHYYGWLKGAKRKYNLSEKTINIQLKSN